MKKLLTSLALVLCISAIAKDEWEILPLDNTTESEAPAAKETKAKKPKGKDVVKTGYNFGPLPIVAFDADKGFQVGGLLNIFNFGDGSNYPNYNSKIYVEASYFTKGSQLYQLMYDNRTLIPGVRWSSAASLTIDKAMDFYGFGGYSTYYDSDRITLGKQNKKGPQEPANYIFTPFYRLHKLQVQAKTDFIGDITKHFKWEVGYHFGYYKMGAIDRESINKKKPDYNIYPSAADAADDPFGRERMSTLYEDFVTLGIIGEKEAKGGFVSSIRAGLVFDSRDKEGAPTKGIWAEGHITAAPRWLGTTSEFYRYSLTFRHYVALVKKPNVLTFAYRLNYEGTIGKSAPYYVLPFITVMGENNDKDGFGGYRTVRGIIRNRVVGLDMASYNIELRWRFVNFKIGKQNISLGLSAFSDGAMVTRNRSLAIRPDIDLSLPDNAGLKENYEKYVLAGRKDFPHVTIGAGLRFIMNENFIVAFEYGSPVTHFLKATHPLKNQDGTGAFYINTGYLF